MGLDIKPGIELDKLIVEKVLGWHQDSEMGGTRAWWYDKKGEGPLYLNHFSTDIKAAWDLAEKFRLCVIPWGKNKWTAFQEGLVFFGGERNSAPTAAHAICLAVLNIVSLYGPKNGIVEKLEDWLRND